MSSDKSALAAAAKLAPHGLDAAQQSQLVAVLEALAKDEHAPTTVHDPQLAADAVVFMAGLPLDANVQFLTITATTMPFIGRG